LNRNQVPEAHEPGRDVLDARLRERLRVELREIQLNYGLTWIYVTHDQQEALSLADRAVADLEGWILGVR
jgi:iron(III) transport system ATP-binding protein